MGDNITRPDHYCAGREYEPKDVIRDWGLNFNLGSAVKYISRAGRKGDKLEDLQKAKQFLEFEIEELEKVNESELADEKILESHVNGVLNGAPHMIVFTKSHQKEIITRIVERIDAGELDCVDVPLYLYRDYKEIKDAVERKTSWYTNGILGQWYYYQNIPDGYKARVIDKIVQEVLDSQIIPPDDVRAAVIDRIVKMVNNGELDLMDIPDDLYDECVRSRSAFTNREYCKIEAAEKERSKNITCVFGCTCDVLDGKMKFEDVQEVLKPLVLKGVADEVLNGVVDISSDILSDELRKLVIDRIVERLVDGELSLLDIPCSLFNYIGMTCKEAAEIGDAIAKGFEESFKKAEEKHDESELDVYCRGFDAGYDMAHADLRSVEDTFTISFIVKED